MSEVVHLPTSVERSPVVVNHQGRAVQMLGEWAVSAEAAHRVATQLVETSFVPVQFRGKPLEATAAILAGLEIGLQPMAALKSFDIIQGVAAPRAMTLRAIVQSYGHEIVLMESTDSRCKMKGRRRDSIEWQHVTWTLDRAKQLGLTGKDNWRKQPAAMLVARATSELARLVASDAILGLGYSAEEIADQGEGGPISAGETIVEQPAQEAPRKLSRKPLQPSQPEPEPEEPATEALLLQAGDEDDPWAALVPLLTIIPGPASTVTSIEADVRRLFRLMELTHLWPTTDSGDALHKALKKHHQVEHLADLKKSELVEFAKVSWEAAREAANQSPERPYE